MGNCYSIEDEQPKRPSGFDDVRKVRGGQPYQHQLVYLQGHNYRPETVRYDHNSSRTQTQSELQQQQQQQQQQQHGKEKSKKADKKKEKALKRPSPDSHGKHTEEDRNKLVSNENGKHQSSSHFRQRNEPLSGNHSKGQPSDITPKGSGPDLGPSAQNADPAVHYFEDRKEKSKEKDRKLDEYREKLSRKDEEYHALRKEKETLQDNIHKLEKDNEHQRKELKKEKDRSKHLENEKNDLLNRLSSEAAARMTNSNPNITDLSDENRATKISEKYSELYDNQWTDAFEILQTKFGLLETSAIEYLLNMLIEVFHICKSARLQKDRLQAAIKEYLCVSQDDGRDINVLEALRTLQDARKKNVQGIKKMYKERVQNKLNSKSQTEKEKQKLSVLKFYIDECVEVCLLMNIQDPPNELSGKAKPGDKFDLSVYRAYTFSGEEIEFVVWPYIHLCMGGPLLCKGIAQGRRASNCGGKIASLHDKKSAKVDVNEGVSINESQSTSVPKKANTEQGKERAAPGMQYPEHFLSKDVNTSYQSKGTRKVQSMYDERTGLGFNDIAPKVSSDQTKLATKTDAPSQQTGLKLEDKRMTGSMYVNQTGPKFIKSTSIGTTISVTSKSLHDSTKSVTKIHSPNQQSDEQVHNKHGNAVLSGQKSTHL